MNDNKQSNQSRFLIAAVLSMMVLLGWSYFFAPKKTENANANVNSNAVAANSATPTPATENQPKPEIKEVATSAANNNPQRNIVIKSPIYQVKLDSQGALATSWILIKNVRQGAKDMELWADGSTDNTKNPLELVQQNSPNREYPFRISTGNNAVDGIINNKNYQVVGDVKETVDLNGGQSVTVDFVLKDQITFTESGTTEPIEITKSFTFHSDSYISDLKITAKRNGQPLTNTKLLIGTAIGDQGIKIHDYYHIEPEAVAFANDTIERHQAASLFKTKEVNEGNLVINGDVDWAGVGDSYFAMAAIPASKTNGLEFKATKITKDVEPHYTGLWSWITRNPTTRIDNHLVTAFVPINADGSTTKIYAGSKDFFTLRDYSTKLDAEVGRTTNLGELINYSNWWQLRWIQRPVAQFLLICLNAIYSIVGNYGVAIIVFTFIFYSIFFPIRWFQSKQFKKAQGNAPKMKDIQDRIKEMQKKGVPLDDPRMRELQMEQLKLTKDAIPIMGCLPMLLQIPLFVALYTAVTIGIDFRHAAFLWLPDLAGSDPYHILEFLFAGSMAGSMVFTPTAPAVTDEQKMQQRMMTYLMPGMLLFMMWGSSAGLLLYWFFGNIVSFGQQFIINRMNKNAEVAMKTI